MILIIPCIRAQFPSPMTLILPAPPGRVSGPCRDQAGQHAHNRFRKALASARCGNSFSSA